VIEMKLQIGMCTQGQAGARQKNARWRRGA
jgi:hypothetical protein